ncbi:hypothetical protein KM043_016476 [Ampulex compressa]|nr:hypothetical protein KM043_016476 [Ampulex compressa]
MLSLLSQSWSLVCIVVLISGFALCLLASFCSGVRWTMTQLIMQRSKLGLRNPVDMMYYMQPWMLLPIIPVTLWFEGSNMYNGLKETNWTDSCTILLTTSAIVSGAILAFNMELMEFLVVTYTSSLTLSISGILKEICILILAFEWKGERMSGVNFIGLLLCLSGIVFHIVQKVFSSKHESKESLELQQNSDVYEGFKSEESGDLNLPLLSQKSTSLTNLLTAEFSTDDEEVEPKNDESPSQILSNILQRREP